MTVTYSVLMSFLTTLPIVVTTKPFSRSNTACRRRSSRAEVLKDKPPTLTETTPFVITYNPTLPYDEHIIHKHSHVLYSSEHCRNVLKNPPIVAYRRSNNLSHILVRALNCQGLIVTVPGPLPVFFGAITGTAPHAPILTTAVTIILSTPPVKPTKSNLTLLVIAEPQRARAWCSIPPHLRKFGNLSVREKFGYDVTVPTSVRTFRVELSRNESLPSPLESFVPYCFKGFGTY